MNIIILITIGFLLAIMIYTMIEIIDEDEEDDYFYEEKEEDDHDEVL